MRCPAVDPKVAHFESHNLLDQAVTEGCDAYDRNDHEKAARHWGRAVRLAHRLGDEKMLSRLAKLVEIDDPVAGEVRGRGSVPRSTSTRPW